MKIKDTRKKFKHSLVDANAINKSILRQYTLIAAIWLIVVLAIITLIVLYTHEVNNINSTIVNCSIMPGKTVSWWKENMYLYGSQDQQLVYKSMIEAVFGDTSSPIACASKMPIIWFSNMLFIPQFKQITDWITGWNSKMLQVTTCQVYMLISATIAVVGLGFYIYLLSSYSIKLHIANKKGFTNKYPLCSNDLGLYTTSSYLHFFVAISIFFTFYSLSATLVMLVYMLVIKNIYKSIYKHNESKNDYLNIFDASELSYFGMLFIIMAVMVAYNMLTGFFNYWISVDISTVLDALFATCGIAVVIFTLVRNMLASSITDIRKKMKKIDSQIKQIEFFYRIRKQEAAHDYQYLQILPPVIKRYIANNKKIDPKVLDSYFNKLFDYTEFVKELDMGKSKKNKKRKNFILYRMYNEIQYFAEFEDIQINLTKEFKK